MYCQFQFPLCCALIMLSTLAEPESSPLAFAGAIHLVTYAGPCTATYSYVRKVLHLLLLGRSKVTDELSKNSCKIHNAAGRLPQRSKQHHKRWNLIIEVIIIINHYESAMVGGQQSLGTVIKGHKKLEISLQQKPTKMLSLNGIYFPLLSLSLSLFHTLLCSILSFFSS